MGSRRRQPFLASLVFVICLFAPSPVAAANYPVFTYSIYVTSSSGTAATNAGCDLATAVANNSRPMDAFVVLDFGYPDQQSGVWGTLLITASYPFVSTSSIAAIAEDFGSGFWNCAPLHATLRLAIGENTSNVSQNGQSVNFFTGPDGTAWAGMVNNVNSWLASHGYASAVTAAGAADIENASKWASFSNVKAWADAFSAASGYAYYDFGSANGCAWTNTFGNNSCNAGWNTYDEWYASWGAANAYPAPEDYNETYHCATQGCSFGNVDANSRQWEATSRYGYHSQSGAILVRTVVTQHEACAQVGGCIGTNNTPAEGDGDMYNALNHDYAPSETSQSIEWTTDMEWGYARS